MTHVTCRLTAKNREELQNRTLGNRVYATFTFYLLHSEMMAEESVVCFCDTVCSRLKLHRVSDPLAKMDSLPGVTIVKPLMGVDPYLETNLESHFTLDYPKVQ